MSTPIEVPPSLPPQVRRPDGDAASAAVLAAALKATAARFEKVAEGGDRRLDLGCCCGAGQGDAPGEQAGRIAARHAAMARTLEQVGSAVAAYADTLRELMRDWEAQVERKAALDERRASLLADLEAFQEPRPEGLPALRERAGDLRAGYHQLVTDHDDAQRRASDGEEQLRQAFQAGTLLGEALAHVDGVVQVRRVAQDALARLGAEGMGGSPAEVGAWWERLCETERSAVATAYPALIGDRGLGH